jgi:hypothetical protein
MLIVVLTVSGREPEAVFIEPEANKLLNIR